MPAAPGAPPLGQPSMNADQVNAAYQSAFGRPATGSELASELENANKYGAQGILNTIAARTNNAPGSGEHGTATWSSLAASNPHVASMASIMMPHPAMIAPHAAIAPMHIAPMQAMPSPTFQPAPVSPQPTPVAAGYAGDPNGNLGLMLARYRTRMGY